MFCSRCQNIKRPATVASHRCLLGQMLGHDPPSRGENIRKIKWLSLLLAEREGFEPPIRLPVCRISSAVLSTTLPPLRGRNQSPVVVRGVLTKAVRRNKGGAGLGERARTTGCASNQRTSVARTAPCVDGRQIVPADRGWRGRCACRGGCAAGWPRPGATPSRACRAPRSGLCGGPSAARPRRRASEKVREFQ